MERPDILLSNGVTIKHKPLGTTAFEAYVDGSDREMTDAEWTEYSSKIKAQSKPSQ